VIEVVNRHADRIQTFTTTQASLSGPGFPTIPASIAFERPMRFRLRGQTGLTGAEIDIGSNDELFWFWVRRNQPPALYFCRHDQFATSPVRRTIPIEPAWLIEALGVARLDPALPHQGPFPAGKGRIAMRTIRETPEGQTMKVTVIDAGHGVVLEQHLYDCRSQLQASAVEGRYRQDPLSGLFMPTVVEIRSPPNQFAVRIDLGNVQINQPLASMAQLWIDAQLSGLAAGGPVPAELPGGAGRAAVGDDVRGAGDVPEVGKDC